jgi:extracellular factor (EF) 3-hydroxypalmitic acid methyl ester biosynthesis protein
MTCLDSQGTQLRANCLRLNRHVAVFEVLTPQAVLQSSEVLTEFSITLNGRTVYTGRAVVKCVISSSTTLVCEVTLADSWVDVESLGVERAAGKLQSDFADFLRISSNGFRILPEFKLMVADLQMFLLDLRQWLDQAEFRVQCQSSGNQQNYESEILRSLESDTRPVLTRLFERFEEACGRIDPDFRPAHAHYVKRQLHPIVLCAPFMYRCFQKPLGYAGDYEMINMMAGDTYRGPSAFAKVLNTYFLSTPPVVAHRHRMDYLAQMLQELSCLLPTSRRPMKVFNLGCGPALEIQEFLANSELSNHAQFTLLDFNDETIEHVSRVLQTLKQSYRRAVSISCIKKSVVEILKEAARRGSSHLGVDYDLVYCAGLFDYLTSPVCEKLMSLFYEMLAPGGLLVATNVFAINPSRNWMEYSVDWHVIHRDRAGILAICPKQAPSNACVVKSDPTGLNLFLEVRKPIHG